MDEDLVIRLAVIPKTVSVNQGSGKPPAAVRPDFVFYSPEGKPFQPQNWSRRFYNRFMDDLHREYPEIPRLTPHELRHTRATLWLAQGIPELMVAKLLGHCDLKMLAKIYDHTDIETLRREMKKGGEAARSR